MDHRRALAARRRPVGGVVLNGPRLDGCVAIVTGGGRGLGESIARGLAAAGARVCVSDLDEAAAARVAATLPGAFAQGCDVTSEPAMAALVEAAVTRAGKLDIMVANAGIAKRGALSEMSLADWRAVTAVNLDGVFLATRFAAPRLTSGGSIVNIASITAQAGVPFAGSYAAAKAGVVSLTQTAARELRDRGIRVNAILPGFVDTELVKASKAALEADMGIADFDAAIAARQGRYGLPEEVAALAVWLASERASFCTGGSYVIDGGARASLL